MEFKRSDTFRKENHCAEKLTYLRLLLDFFFFQKTLHVEKLTYLRLLLDFFFQKTLHVF